MPTDPVHPDEGYAIASAAFGDPLRTVDCLVKSTSDKGALLKISNPERLPDHFLLIAMSEQIRRSCKVVERAEHSLRVEFVRG